MSASTRHRFPLRVENLLAEAGGSIYAWYENELEKRLDPDGSARKLSHVLQVAAFLVPLVLATVLLATRGHAVLVASLALVYVVANWIIGTGTVDPPAWQSTVLLTALTVGWTVSPWAGVWSAIAGVVLTRVVMHARRDASMVALHVGAVVTAAFVPSVAGSSVLVALAGLVTGWVVSWFLQGRRAMGVVPVRLRREQFSWTLPDPPSRLPFLLRSRACDFAAVGASERRTGSRAPEDAALDMKKIGGAGERRTGLLLLGLKRWRFTRIVHDVQVPGATRGANADHVVLARSGGWVLDSKWFGSKKDPGVVRRTNTGQVMHLTGYKANDLGKTLHTLAWAVRGIRQEMQIPFRGLLVVHNAEVEPGLSVVVPGRSPAEGDVTVDVLSSQHLVAYLDSAPAIMSRREISAAGWGFQAKQVSATTGRSPQMVAPIGGGPSVMPVAPPRAQTRADSSASAPSPAPEPSGGAGRASDESPSGADSEVLPADPVFPGEGPKEMVVRQLREKWHQIELSEPAAPDDVPEEMRQLRAGAAISRIGFTADLSDVRSDDLVALSGPCQGVDGPFVWACSPQQWDLHVTTGQPVNATTFSLETLALRPTDGVDGL